MNRREQIQVLVVQGMKFIIVGIMNTGITLSVIFILQKLLNVHYVPSNVTGYVMGLINSFLWNRNWTFKSNGNVLRESVVFLIIFGICYSMQLAFLVILIEVLEVDADISQLIAMFFYTAINFILNKYFTFRRKEN